MYEIQTNTISDGWTNTGWVVYPDGTEGPAQYETLEEAQQELDELIEFGQDPVDMKIVEVV
jgi:predicted RNase H-like HicB family nuclease